MLQQFVSKALSRWSKNIDHRSSDKYYCWKLWCLYVIRKTLTQHPYAPKYWNIFKVVQEFFSGNISLQKLRYEMYPYIMQYTNQKEAFNVVISKCLYVICEMGNFEDEILEIGMLCEKIFPPADLLEIGRSILNEVSREVAKN